MAMYQPLKRMVTEVVAWSMNAVTETTDISH